MYQKFIINEGRLKAGVVDEHFELAEDHSTTRGGGWWHMDAEKRKIWLYHKSIRFGRASVELLKEIIAAGRHDYQGYTFYYSSSREPDDAMKGGELLG